MPKATISVSRFPLRRSRSLSENREPTAEKPFWPIFPLIFVKYEQLFALNDEKMDSKRLPLATASILGQAPSRLCSGSLLGRL